MVFVRVCIVVTPTGSTPGRRTRVRSSHNVTNRSTCKSKIEYTVNFQGGVTIQPFKENKCGKNFNINESFRHIQMV